MYVLKYAKTAKIKNIVDTFIKKLESAQSFEITKKEIASNEKERDEVVKRIHSIEAKLKSGEEAKKFKKDISAINYDSEIAKLANNIIKKAQEKITKQLKDPKMKMSVDEAESLCAQFAKFANSLQAEVQVELEKLIANNVQKNAEGLLEQYKKKLADLADEINVGDVELDPFEIMKGELPSNNSIISNTTKTEKVVVGREEDEWIENENKKWYKPWTWFQEKGHWTYKDIIEEQEYVDGKQLADKFFAPIQEQLFENSSSAQKYAKKEAKRIKEAFEQRFEELDILLSKKLDELKACATDEQRAQKQLEEAQSRLEWLDDIYSRVNAILEI
jgi:hypothetical protein